MGLLLLLAPQDPAQAKVEEALNAAQAAYDAGKYADAIDLLGDLPYGEDAPQRALVIAGRAQLALGRPEGAISSLLRASDHEPTDTALARDAALACYRSASGPFARAYLEDAQRYAERSGDALLQADVAYALGDLAGALERYRALKPAEDLKLAVLQRIADCEQQLGNEKEARDAWRAVLEEALARGDLRSAYRAAESGQANGRLLAWLDEHLTQRPEDSEARLYRGYARARAQLYVEAAEDLRAVLAAGRDAPSIRGRLAFCLVRQGMRAQDMKMMREGVRVGLETLEQAPMQEEAWAELQIVAWYAWRNNDVPFAYEVLKAMHEHAPDDYDVGLNYAAMARRLDHPDESRAVYDRLLEENPGDPSVTNDYGILEDGLGNRGKAIELWSRALEEDPRNLDSLENLFTAAWETGDTARAKELGARGLEVATSRGDQPLIDRWHWFLDRLRWAPTAWGG